MNTTMNNVKQHRVPRIGERHARIYTIGRAPGRGLAALTIAACLWAPMTSGARAQTLVTPSGSFAPEADNVDRPFRLVEAAIAAERSDSLIAVSPGIYKEAFILDKPCVLQPSDAGVVTVGDLSAVATTTLKIATLNTHLFGDTAFAPTWQDDQRAIDIGEICRDSDWDVVAFQEIWDEDLFFGGFLGQEGIKPISGFQDGDHGDDTDCPGCINSGLAIMSRVGMTDFQQKFFSDCPGAPCVGTLDDCLAAKGWVETKITKDGFPIRILNSHTQAGNSGDRVAARFSQMMCLLSRGLALRDFDPDPDVTIVIVGDFNIGGETLEYIELYVRLLSGDVTLFEELFGVFAEEFLETFFGDRFAEIIGYWDGARNVPGFDPDEHYTNSPDNLLSLCFDPKTFDARLDYVIVIPPISGLITVIPESVNVFKFLGRELTDLCLPLADTLTSTEKSDHWGVEAEIKFFRN